MSHDMQDKWEGEFLAGENERNELIEIIQWSYSKLHSYSFSKQEDALMLDRMKLLLEHNI